ncbi:MAG: YfhO family protein [Anaerolineales bacterium]
MAEGSFLFRLKKLLCRIDPVYAILAAALILLFAPVLAGAQSIFWGLPLLQFYPWHEFAKQTVLEGYLPLWNPMLGMGAPLLANAQSALLYPPNWILLVVPVDYGQGLLMVAHLLWAGIGMAKLARSLGIGRLGQAVGGLAFMLSGYLAARAWFLTINASVAWLPWIILAGENAGRQKRGLFSAPLAFALCLQWLAGHWQTAWYTGLILAGWMAVRAFGARPFWKQAAYSVARLLSAGLFAALLGAAQFFPTVGYWLHSQRSGGVDPEAALAYSFWPWRLITLVAPDFFGNPARGDYWGYANYWEDAVYIGLLPLGLAVWAAVRGLRRKGAAGFPYGYLLALLPLSLILALGTNTPVFPFLFEHVPTFDFFQAPARIMIIFVFALCLLAAAGAERWMGAEGGSRDGSLRLGVAAAGVALAGIGAGFIANIRPSFSSSIAAAGVIGLLIAGLGFLKYMAQVRPLAARLFPVAAAALVACDLAFAARGLVPAASPALYRSENPVSAELAAGLDGRRIYMPEDIRYRLMYERAFVFRTFQGLADWMDVRRWELPNVGVLDGISSANNFDSFVFSRYATLMEGLETLPAVQRDRILQMMDVGAEWEWAAGAEIPSLRFLPGGSAPVWGVCRAEWMISPEDAWQAVMDPLFDPARTVILELGGGTEGGDCVSPPAVSPAARRNPNAVRIEVDFPEDGYLIQAELNDHGWEAFLDGERVPVLQADYALRAVRVPAGKHVVEFVYTPLAFWVGALVSGAALLIVLAAGFYKWIGVFKKREKKDLQEGDPG